MMIFGLSDTSATAIIMGAFGLVTTIGAIMLRRIEANILEAKQDVAATKQEVVATKDVVVVQAEKLAKLEKNTDGLREALVLAVGDKKFAEGREQAKSDMKAGAEIAHGSTVSIANGGDVLNATAPAEPQQVQVVNPEPVPVVVRVEDEQGKKIAELASEKSPNTKEGK